MKDDYDVGEYIIYINGERMEIGRIKSLRNDGAFVAYHDGETGAKTPYDCMHKILNSHVIKDTTLGGSYFKRNAIDHQYCINALLKMWVDNVVTDGEYFRILDKLNAMQEEKDGTTLPG